ncbi:MAG: GPR1/FUN34/YaaH family transporter [Syntrophorhabdales bacterium]|jgi:succinate-acetate transporter protein
MGESRFANAGVVGLGGFGFTTMMLQFHNLGWCGLGPVLVCALIFGGLAQLILGFQEMRTGNS